MGDDEPAPEAGQGTSRRPHGALEAEVMDVLRAAAPLSPGQVRERLSEDLSYSTVVTIVSRLHAKGLLERERTGRALDRKSTRLNSSHMSISYAVFCLKKKRN